MLNDGEMRPCLHDGDVVVVFVVVVEVVDGVAAR